MIRPMKVEWLITRKCNLSCEYCMVPKVTRNELDARLRIKVLDILNKWDTGIVGFFGGEPTLLGDELIGLLSHSNAIGLPYYVITNGLSLWADEVFKQKFAEVSMNLTVSLDWPEEYSAKTQGGIGTKTMIGWKLLHDELLTSEVPDRVVNMTIWPENARYASKVIREATALGVWTGLSIINEHKTGFEYSNPPDEMLFRTDEDMKLLERVVGELCDMKRSGDFKMHDSENLFRSWLKWGRTPQQGHCSRITKLALDCDGTIRCCVDWAGKSPFTIFELDEMGDDASMALEVWFADNIEECPGCCWSPMLLLETYGDDEAARENLKHGVW